MNKDHHIIIYHKHLHTHMQAIQHIIHHIPFNKNNLVKDTTHMRMSRKRPNHPDFEECGSFCLDICSSMDVELFERPIRIDIFIYGFRLMVRPYYVYLEGGK